MDQRNITLTWEKKEGSADLRLDRFLAVNFLDYSRSYFKKRLLSGDVRINGGIVTKPSYLLQDRDEVTVLFPLPKAPDLAPRRVDFEVIFVHEDYIIIEKPAGLIVHTPHPEDDQDTLVHGLLYMFKELSQFKDTIRPGIVHRLDKDTSGLMVVARNESAHFKLAEAFSLRTVSKTYLAIVRGHPEPAGTISYPIGRSPKDPRRMSHQGFAAKDAITHYKVLAYYKNAALVAASPVTGRTHQIRVHLASIGHGILGDRVYGYHSPHIKRQALHAWKLSVPYQGERRAFVKQLPSDMTELLKVLHHETSK